MDKRIIEKVAKEFELPVYQVEGIINRMLRFVSLKLDETIDLDTYREEDYDSLKKSFNIPSLGKIYVNKNKLNKLKSEYEKRRDRRSSIQQCDNDSE